MPEPKELFPVKFSTRAEVDHRQEPTNLDNAVEIRTVHIPGKIDDGQLDLRPREVKFEVEVTSAPKAPRPVASSATDSAYSFGNVESASGQPSETTTVIHPSQLSAAPEESVSAEKVDPSTTQDLDTPLDMF